MARVTPAATLVALHHVSFRFESGITLFDSLDLVLDRVPTGVVGRNGVGKSMLAQLIAGRIEPTSGKIDRHVRVAYAAQQHLDTSHDTRTVAQVMGVDAPLAALARLENGTADSRDFDAIGERWDLAARVRTALDAAGLDHLESDTLAYSLSGGELARVTLIGALLADASLLVLDEPTNHLDGAGRAWLRGALDAWRGGLVVVSHDRAVLADMQRIVEVTPKGLRIYGGDYASYRIQRDAEHEAAKRALSHARTERERATRRLQREHDTIQRHAAGTLRYAKTANLSSMAKEGIKGGARHAMGQVRAEQREHKEALDGRVTGAAARVEPEAPVLVALPGAEVSARSQVFTLEEVGLPWLAHVDPAATLSWSCSGPVRVALRGPNGCGKSTLLRLIAGQLAPQAGRIVTHVRCAYLDQKLAMLDPDRSIAEQLGLLDTPLAEGALRSRLALLQLDATRVTQPSRYLSGGERLKAALACALWRGTPAQMLLLDEPTNHLDLESVRAIERALADFPGALIVASHDADFIAALGPTHTMQWSREGWRFDPII
ncbi:ABC-F family ATP-binding cassette domain-containing protein [Paraburkholderia acidiphila]|uniref:ATP-binding cassette domain-containing protein n=1 Tax=Paraburkholderia acidiphila TaxID=2571747 RepID=A0A7Z2JBX5_9BURK|nr:ABC-F family ATP-binding cassette domain-containing protein [Paraburkholderia acidiphila]QGZ59482.1 ATP-binding cassette domain-containing protein [Paraburkholderia acidiphila]